MSNNKNKGDVLDIVDWSQYWKDTNLFDNQHIRDVKNVYAQLKGIKLFLQVGKDKQLRREMQKKELADDDLMNMLEKIKNDASIKNMLIKIFKDNKITSSESMLLYKHLKKEPAIQETLEYLNTKPGAEEVDNWVDKLGDFIMFISCIGLRIYTAINIDINNTYRDQLENISGEEIEEAFKELEFSRFLNKSLLVIKKEYIDTKLPAVNDLRVISGTEEEELIEQEKQDILIYANRIIDWYDHSNDIFDKYSI